MGYTICDDGRREADAYFLHRYVTNARHKEHKNATAKKVTNLMFAKAGGRKQMYVLIRNRNPNMADMAMADMARVLNWTTNFVPTAGWSVRPCLSIFGYRLLPCLLWKLHS